MADTTTLVRHLTDTWGVVSSQTDPDYAFSMVLEFQDGEEEKLVRSSFVIPDEPATKGGAGSGNFGHAGIPGHQGGSAGGGGYARGKELQLSDVPGLEAFLADDGPLDGIDLNDPNVKNAPDLAAVLKAQGFDGKPEVVTKKELTALVNNEGYKEKWRGVGAERFKEQFKTGEVFVGQGAYGCGTYVTGSKKKASVYGWGIKPIRMALRPDAKVISGGELSITIKKLRGDTPEREDLTRQAMQARYRKNHDKEAEYLSQIPPLTREQRMWRKADISTIAALLGYDAFSTEFDRGYDALDFIILNRTALVVEA